MMAKMSFHLPEETLKKMEGLGKNYDKVVGVVLTEGSTPLFDAAKQSLNAVIGQKTKHDSETTGDLLNSLDTTKPYLMSDGSWNIKVGCEGIDRKGISNALKASVLEHGKSDQPAKPWLKTSVSKARKYCIQKMKETLEREVEKL
jgi:hypothetical protein